MTKNDKIELLESKVKALETNVQYLISKLERMNPPPAAPAKKALIHNNVATLVPGNQVQLGWI